MNYKLSFILILFFLKVECASATQLQTDQYTKILMHFDNGNDNITYTDVTGRVWTHEGSSASQSSISVPDGSVSSLLLDKTQFLYIQTSNVSDLSPNIQNFTIEFKAKRNSIGDTQTILSNELEDGLVATSTFQLIFLPDGRMRLGMGNGTSYTFVTSTSGINDTNWHSYMIQRTGKYVVLFKDGKFWGYNDIGSTFSLYNGTVPWVIGKAGTGSWSFFNGYIDEFRYSVGISRLNTTWMDWYAFGDSNTDATNAELSPNDGSLCYVFTLVSHNPALYGDNCRAGYGQDSAWGTANVASYYPNPKNYLIMFGSNDMQTGGSAATAANNVKTIYNYVTARGSKAIVLVPPVMYDDGGTPYRNVTYQHTWLTNFENNLSGIPHLKAYDAIDTIPRNGIPEQVNTSYFVSDGRHLSATGQAVLGNFIWNNLAGNFTVLPLTGSAPLTVKVNYTNSFISPTSWYCDFENDTHIDSTLPNPAHVYDQAGTYSINLTVNNTYGNFSTIKTNCINVSPQTPPNTFSELFWLLKGYFGLILPLREAV